MTVQDASRHVTDGVKLWASQNNAVQTPTLQYGVAGDIVLTRYNKESQSPPLVSPPPSIGYRQRLAKWLEHWDFTANPFDSWDADNEVDVLPSFMIDRPYVTGVLGDPKRPADRFLLAGRGAGKSAARESARRECASGRVHAFPVCYTDFARLLRVTGGDLGRISPRDHVAAILQEARVLWPMTIRCLPTLVSFRSRTALFRSILVTFADQTTQSKLPQLVPVMPSNIDWTRVSQVRHYASSLVWSLDWWCRSASL